MGCEYSDRFYYFRACVNDIRSAFLQSLAIQDSINAGLSDIASTLKAQRAQKEQSTLGKYSSAAVKLAI